MNPTRFIQVHPHACGDNKIHLPACARTIGSPPRVWGQPPKLIIWLQNPRFTPTRVGTTEMVDNFASWLKVHPHACGDNGGNELIEWINARFTPTRVGTTITEEGTFPCA